ncbi:glycosyltransferase [Sphingomonas sp. ASV193]|uniref:glycosyltransferase n=1 Tax=Sphingomonas sp. ASV193 TaxID=3144405 RepID=UPI0032E8D0C4
MSKPLDILVVTPRLNIAGVSLAQQRFARALARAGHRVTLMIGNVDEGLALPDFKGVRTVVVGRRRAVGMFGPIARYLRKERPDVVFSAEDHLNTLVLLAALVTRSTAKISGSSRVTPFDTYSNKPLTKRWVLKHLARSVAWRADALTCVSKDMVEQYRRVFRDPKHQAVYNIVDDAASRARIAEPVDDPWLNDKTHPVLVAVGSLQPWKGFATLIDAIAILRTRGREVRLIILGEGPQRAELEERVAALGLGGRIRLPGHRANPLAYFARADASVLSSTVEGMPNVLVEAMLAGCTPVATDCPTGPRELLGDGRYGYLATVGDSASIADAIERALDTPIAKEMLAEAVRPFEESTVIARHFELLGL